MGTFENTLNKFEFDRQVDHQILLALMKELNFEDYDIIGNTQEFKVKLKKVSSAKMSGNTKV